MVFFSQESLELVPKSQKSERTEKIILNFMLVRCLGTVTFLLMGFLLYAMALDPI